VLQSGVTLRKEKFVPQGKKTLLLPEVMPLCLFLPEEKNEPAVCQMYLYDAI